MELRKEAAPQHKKADTAASPANPLGEGIMGASPGYSGAMARGVPLDIGRFTLTYAGMCSIFKGHGVVEVRYDGKFVKSISATTTQDTGLAIHEDGVKVVVKTRSANDKSAEVDVRLEKFAGYSTTLAKHVPLDIGRFTLTYTGMSTIFKGEGLIEVKYDGRFVKSISAAITRDTEVAMPDDGMKVVVKTRSATDSGANVSVALERL